VITQAQQQNREFDLIKVSMVNKEHELMAREATIRQQELLLEVHVRTLEPSLKAAERERQNAQSTIEEADKRLKRAIERESRVLEAERGIILRERDIETALSQTSNTKGSLVQTSIQTRREREKVEAARGEVNAERFRLHTCAMDMSRQMMLIKHSLSHVLRRQRVLVLAGDSPRTFSDEGNGGIDPAHANILYALNSASSALVSLAHNLIDPKIIIQQRTMSPTRIDKENLGNFVTEVEDTFGEASIEGMIGRTTASTEKSSSYMGLNERRVIVTEDSEDIAFENIISDAEMSARAVRAAALKFSIQNSY
jgi:hypothetical protein